MVDSAFIIHGVIGNTYHTPTCLKVVALEKAQKNWACGRL